jgi:hypothetical protein
MNAQVPTARIVEGSVRMMTAKYAPHVFTEHRAIMLASVLNSSPAVNASVFVVLAYVSMRTALVEYEKLSKSIDALEAKCDGNFKHVFDAIRAMLSPPIGKRRPIGFIGTGSRQPDKKEQA